MFPRHHRTEKTTTPWWNDGRYPVNVSLNPLGATVTIRHRTPMCRAFYRHLSLGARRKCPWGETFSRSCGVSER